MNTRRRIFNRIKLSGHVCTIRIKIRFNEMDYDAEHGQLISLQSKKDFLQNEVNEKVKKILGPKFEVNQLEITKGTIDILVLIGTIGAIYIAVSRYKNFIESLNLLSDQLRNLFQRLIDVEDIQVYGGWFPGPDLLEEPEYFQENHVNSLTLILVLYLIVTNLALLFILIWK